MFKTKVKSIIKKNILFFAVFVKNRPFLKSKLLMILDFFPGLKYKLRTIMFKDSLSSNNNQIFDTQAPISPRVQKIYDELLLRQKKSLDGSK